jgi:phosphopantothenoylcysteine synthetase/decarboxylase
MRILVTAGNTQVPIDRVRSLTNIFTGRTGAAIALAAHDRSHAVTLLTSHPESVRDLCSDNPLGEDRWQCLRYITFDDLKTLLKREMLEGRYHALIHSAAVSDYLAANVFAPPAGTRFVPESRTWTGSPPTLADRAAGKVKSDEPELWLRLVRAPKLVDMVRPDWGFRGVLVKFKLEVGVTDEQLLEIAERSRVHSGADLMVANTLEGAPHWAFMGASRANYRRVDRKALAVEIVTAVERLHQEAPHG